MLGEVRKFNISSALWYEKYHVASDNDHGQQGNGSTNVNRRPALVCGFENVKVARVACGSSHSVAWTVPDPPLPAAMEPVMFTTTKDPLGAHAIGVTDHFGPTPDTNDINAILSPKKNKMIGMPSLSRIVLSLDSSATQQAALQHILNALQISFARDCVIAALASSSGGTTTTTTTREDLTEEIQRTKTPESVTDPIVESSSSAASEEEIAHGGGEAPASVLEAAGISTHIVSFWGTP